MNGEFAATNRRAALVHEWKSQPQCHGERKNPRNSQKPRFKKRQKLLNIVRIELGFSF